MQQSEIKEIMAGGGGRWGTMIRPWLWLASKGYADMMRCRRWHYRHGLYKSHGVDAPVISVGNITAGGTGKTPMVAWVAGQLARAGRRPAIITRGYKARGGKSDEAEMLCCLCDCPIIVNADRVAGAKTAIVAGADTIILDDGFQHRRLRRDLDIVLIDALNPFGFDYVLPRGLLREPPGALKDAHAIVITRSDLTEPNSLAALRERLAGIAPKATVHLAEHRPVKAVDENLADVELARLRGLRALAFCGLGNPKGFFGTLEKLGVDLAGRIEYDDHVDYNQTIAERINQQAEALGVDVLLTTQKDAVKLTGLEFARPLWRPCVTMEVVEGGDDLVSRMAEAAPPVEAEQDDNESADEADD
ncbi:MAG: tetraacyldisaccharide 4'-kinase [Planctomycetota bacterium]|jgi:tetraacyldisaccharide 4'-kinase